MMNQFDLPMRLDKAIDEVGVGAMLKHIESNERALIIDFTADAGTPLIVQVKDPNREKLPSKPKHYRISFVEDSSEWLVLTMGGDEIFCE